MRIHYDEQDAAKKAWYQAHSQFDRQAFTASPPWAEVPLLPSIHN